MLLVFDLAARDVICYSIYMLYIEQITFFLYFVHHVTSIHPVIIIITRSE